MADNMESPGAAEFAQGVREFEEYLATAPNDDANRTLHREAAEGFFNRAHAAGCIEALRAKALLRLESFDYWSFNGQWRELKEIIELMQYYVSGALESDAINPVLAPYFRYVKNNSEGNCGELALTFLLTLDISNRFHKYLAINSSCFLVGVPTVPVPQTLHLNCYGLTLLQNKRESLMIYPRYLEALDPSSRSSAVQRAEIRREMLSRSMECRHPEFYRSYVIENLAEWIELALNKGLEHQETKDLTASLTESMLTSIRYISEHEYPVIGEFEPVFDILRALPSWPKKNGKNYSIVKAMAEYLIARELSGGNFTGVLKYPLATKASTPRVTDANGPFVAVLWYQQAVQTDETIISMLATESEIKSWRGGKPKRTSSSRL